MQWCPDMRLTHVSAALPFLVLGLSSVLGGCGGDEPTGPAPFESRSSASRDSDDREGTTLEVAETNELPGTETDDDAPAASSPAESEEPTATVRLDGVDMKVTEITLWAPNAEGEAHVFIKFDGQGAPAGTDLLVSLTKIGKGCVASPKPQAQDVWLRPPNTADQFHSADGPACGLEITSFPATVGGSASGTFRGSVAGINGAKGTTRSLDVAFRVPRTK